MDKIYRLKNVVNNKLEHLGHVVGKYRREFKVDKETGEVTKLLKNSCVRCGAPVIITDKPTERYPDEMSGTALEIFCKNGPVKIEMFATKNVFAPNNKQDYEEQKKDRLRKAEKKYGI